MDEEDTKWGLYQWFEEHGAELIHPDDLSVARDLVPNGKVFQRLGESEGYLRLRYGDREIRVRPSLFKPLPQVPRGFGEHVLLKNGRAGTIIGIQWHFQRAEPMYQLRLGEKKSTKRYWETDFI